MKKKTLNIPKLESSEVIHEAYFKVRKESVRYSNEYLHQYHLVEIETPAVIVLPITIRQTIVVLEEYRHPTKKTLLGPCAGSMDPLETPFEASERELEEETGYQASSFELLGTGYPYPGLSGQPFYYVLAIDAEKVKEPTLEPAEVLFSFEIDKEALIKRLLNEDNVDVNLSVAFAYYLLRKR